MARPLSEEKRQAILDAAMTLVAAQGLGASTADIAKQAGVPNGSVFTYFETKSDLLNALYLALKTEATGLVLEDMPGGKDAKAQMRHLWNVWTRWGIENPEKRKALAQLSVSDQVTGATWNAATKMAAPLLDLLVRSSANGALKDAPHRYAAGLVEAMVNTTMDFMLSHPKDAKKISQAGFEAMWKMLN